MLERNGVACVYLEWKNVDDVKKAVTLMGEVLNKKETADAYIAYFDEKLAQAASLTSGIPEKTLLPPRRRPAAFRARGTPSCVPRGHPGRAASRAPRRRSGIVPCEERGTRTQDVSASYRTNACGARLTCFQIRK